MKKFFGYLIMAVFVLLIFIAQVVSLGFWGAVLYFVLMAALLGVMLLAIYLIYS